MQVYFRPQRYVAPVQGGGGGGGGSSYTPTLWVNSATGDDSRSKATVAASGGSLPWATIGRAAWGSTNRSAGNSSEAAAAGDVVSVAAGTYDTAGVGSDAIAYRTENDGTSGNPIVFFADGAVTLTLSSNGSAIGAIECNWVTWSGFTIDDRTNQRFAADGVINIQSSDGCVIENCTVIGRNNDAFDGDQYCAIVIYDVGNVTIRNNTLYGFGVEDNLTGLGDADENATAITAYYRCENVLIENNDIYQCGAGMYLKGIRHASGVPDYTTGPCTVRYNKVYNCKRGIKQYLANFDSASPLMVYQNIVYDCPFAGIESFRLGGTTETETQHVKFVNNTIYNCGTSSGEGKLIAASKYLDNQYIEFHNNLCVGNTADTAVVVFGTTLGTNADIFERNVWAGFTDFAITFPDTINFASWQALGADPNGNTTAPTFVNAGSRDLHLSNNGQDALTRGRVVFGIGGTNGDTIPVGCYITGTETIGR